MMIYICGAGLIFGVAFMIAGCRWLAANDEYDRKLFSEWLAKKEKGDE